MATTKQLPEVLAELDDGIKGLRQRLEAKQAELEERVNDIEARGNRAGIGRAAAAVDEDTGADVYALAPGQSVRAHLKSPDGKKEPEAGVRFGTLIQAMVRQDRTDAEIMALTKGTDASGGFAVPAYYSSEVIDLMRAKSACVQAGALTVPLEGDKTHYLRIASDPVAAWRLEHGDVAASDMTFGRMTFEPKSLAVIVKASREWLEDSINGAQMLEQAFAQAFALELDRVALLGSGTAPEPRGVVQTPGINVYELGANGAPVASYAPILRARQKMLEANAAEPTAAIMAPRTSTAFEELCDTTGQPLQRPRAIEALPFLATTQIPTDDTQGTAENASRVIVGDFAQLWFGVRVGFRVQVLQELYAENMEVGFLAHLRADVQLAQPKAFTDIPGFVPAE